VAAARGDAGADSRRLLGVRGDAPDAAGVGCRPAGSLAPRRVVPGDAGVRRRPRVRAAASRHFESSIRIDTVNAVVPAVVTDTTGAWLLPRNRRVWINLAGPLAETLAALPVAAAVAAGVGGTLPPLLLAVIVADLVFALNPLFHGDGYWIAADLLGAENVRTRGIEAVHRRELTWPAVYVVVSYAVGAAFLLNVVAVTVSVGGVRGLLYAAPVVLLLVFAWADFEVRGV